jgi:glucose-1-phosphate adenylyltransferase
VPREEASALGVMKVDENTRILDFAEKPENPPSIPGKDNVSLASMGIYVFNTDFLIEQLIRDADTNTSSHDFGKNIIPHAVEHDYQVYAFPFVNRETSKQVYWRDVGTIDSYYDANIELIDVTPELNLYDSTWPIWTYQEQLPPAKFIFNEDKRRGMAVDSMVSGGCIISGSHIDHSVLFSNVVVKQHSLVEDSVVLPDVRIGENCKIKNTIIDKSCDIPDGTVIGHDVENDKRKYHISPKGRVLVTPEMFGQEVHHAR